MNRGRAKWLTYMGLVVLLIFLIVRNGEGTTLREVAIGALGSLAVVLTVEVAVRMDTFWFNLLSQTLYRGKPVRVSIAYLIRIRLDNHYVLVWSDRFQHYQPVGGVYKHLPGARPVFDRFGVIEDDKFPPSEDTRYDLRVQVKAEYVPAFLAWFNSCKDREVGPWREFHCELIDTGLLSRERFPFVMFRWLRQHFTGFEFSEFFQCREVKVADVFEAELTPEQQADLRQAVANRPDRLCLANADRIRHRGVTTDSPNDNIAETAVWLLR